MASFELDNREQVTIWLALTDCASEYRKLIAASDNEVLKRRLEDAAEAMEELAPRFC